MKYLSSIQNPLIKNILLLKEKSKARKKQGLFILEGVRELGFALKANYKLTTLLFYSELISEDDVNQLIDNQNVELIEISKEVYQRLALRSTTEGIIAIVKTKEFSLESIRFKNKTPLILVAEAPEKPGNIGALLRTADAVNADAVFIANPKTDMYNSNIIRSSVGCIFTNTIAIDSSENIIQFLQKQKVQLFSAALKEDSEIYTKQDFTKSTAIIVGTEATGLSDEWLKQSKNIIIPMLGVIDSLNVSVSAAIILFEANRQRSLK
ncbi:MAG: RNA methyltransferase [Flavobacteriaceae bacterium]